MPTQVHDARRTAGSAPTDAPTFDLAALTEEELKGLVPDAREIAGGADGLSELFASLATDAATERRGRAGGGEPHVELDLSADLETDPREVVVDQRDAMARAVQLRDDPGRSEGVRQVWAVVVERLALARREAKAAILERRREDDSDASWRDAQLQAEMTRRHSESEMRDASLEQAGPQSNPHAPAPSAHPDAVVSAREAAERSGGESAPWQPEHDRVGPETGPATTPSSTRTTEQLVRGTGMAGGTGAAGSQNVPADRGATSGAPLWRGNKDEQEEAPPDVGQR